MGQAQAQDLNTALGCCPIAITEDEVHVAITTELAKHATVNCIAMSIIFTACFHLQHNLAVKDKLRKHMGTLVVEPTAIKIVFSKATMEDKRWYAKFATDFSAYLSAKIVESIHMAKLYIALGSL